MSICGSVTGSFGPFQGGPLPLHREGVKLYVTSCVQSREWEGGRAMGGERGSAPFTRALFFLVRKIFVDVR